MKVPFWIRLFGLFAALLLAVVSLSGSLQYRGQRRSVSEGYRDEAERIAALLTPIFLDPLLRGYLESPDNQILALRALREKSPDLVRIDVMRDDGQSILANLPGLEWPVPPERTLRLVRPILLPYRDGGGRRIGTIEFVFSTRRIDDALANQIRETFRIALLALALGLVSSLVIARVVTGPLGRLAAGMARLREGDLTVSVPPESSDEIGELAATFNETVEGLRAKKQLLHYVSRSAWEAAHRRATGSVESGTSKTLTILFADIQGFTPMTERTPPAEVVSRLNRYFDEMVRVITSKGGTIDKFIGDAIMAVFERSDANPEDCGAASAVEAGREMQKKLSGLREEGLTEFHARVGVNTGDVILGDIGTIEARRDFTCIGDAVNVAARLCYACPADAVHVGSDSYRRLSAPPPSQKRTGLRVKGIERDLETHVLDALS